MSKLDGKVALVTGGSKGIGFAVAKAYASEGASLIITGRNLDDLEMASKEIGKINFGRILAIQSDSGKLSDIISLFQQISKKHKKIDILFINAGISEAAPIANVTEEMFDNHNNINYKGAFFTVKEGLPFLTRQASIIFVASAAATLGISDLSVYSATKAALVSLTKTLAAELVTQDIRVNSISPGYIKTPLGMRKNRDHYQEICDSIPLENRFGTVEEIAKVAIFLACDATYMTGENLIIDGGLSSITPQPSAKKST